MSLWTLAIAEHRTFRGKVKKQREYSLPSSYRQSRQHPDNNKNNSKTSRQQQNLLVCDPYSGQDNHVSFFGWHITGNLVYAVPRISAVHQLAVDPTILNGLWTNSHFTGLRGNLQDFGCGNAALDRYGHFFRVHFDW
jgi:hypothetical protein